MKLVFPDMKYKAQAEEYIRECLECGGEVNGSGGLCRFLAQSTYEQWLDKVMADIDVANVPEHRVPALTYFYVREEDDRIVGMVNIRLALSDYLRTECGHIGYSTRPSERGKGYATALLGEALRVCARVGITDIIMTCDKDNPASAKVIINNGGILEAEFFSENYGGVIQRYIILNKC